MWNPEVEVLSTASLELQHFLPVDLEKLCTTVEKAWTKVELGGMAFSFSSDSGYLCDVGLKNFQIFIVHTSLESDQK